MLACARIGAIHSVVFGGFSPESLAGRIVDCDACAVITADEGVRGGKQIPLKRNVDAALEQRDVATVIVVTRTGADVPMKDGRDIRYSDRRDQPCDRLQSGDHEGGGPAVHPLHLGLDRKAEGRRPHDRRLCGLGGDDVRLDLRLSRRRHLLVHRRHRLDHRPHLCRLWAARDGRDERDVRRRSQLSRLRPLLGNRRPARRDHLLHRADRDPRADARRRRAGDSATAASRFACSARSASRSTPRRGNGIGASSAMAAARSSTPGGRPRPAAS